MYIKKGKLLAVGLCPKHMNLEMELRNYSLKLNNFVSKMLGGVAKIMQIATL